MPERNDSDEITPEEEKEEQETPPKPRFPHSPTTLNGWGDRAREAMKRALDNNQKEAGDEEEVEDSEDK